MSSIANNIIRTKNIAIQKLCREQNVKELRLFGSALTDRFNQQSSDFDFVADFNDPDAVGIADRFMAFVSGLEVLLGRQADVITRQSIKNPVFRKMIEEQSIQVYGD